MTVDSIDLHRLNIFFWHPGEPGLTPLRHTCTWMYEVIRRLRLRDEYLAHKFSDEEMSDDED